MISAEEAERRRTHVRIAISENRLAGIATRAKTQAVFDAYIRGEIEAGDLAKTLTGEPSYSSEILDVLRGLKPPIKRPSGGNMQEHPMSDPSEEELPTPPLFGEDYLSAQMLDIVSRYCDAGGGELDSQGDPLRAELMRLCAEIDDIEITAQFGDRITGKMTPAGSAALERFRGEQSADKDIDWSQCPDVESVPGRCSGAWVAKDSRVMVDGILINAADASAAEIADMFELPVEQVQRILAFAGVAPPDDSDIPPLDDAPL